MHGSISVGVPCRNNGPTLARTVESILAQTRAAVAVTISDNASSDETAEIGPQLQARFPTVTYLRQPATMTPTANFKWLVERATTDYFMWLAADDYILPGFLEATAACLDSSPDVVCCVSQIMFATPDGETSLSSGTRSLDGSAAANIAGYLHDPGANGRVYGLYRTDALRRSMPAEHMHAWDWAAVVRTLKYGRHREIPEPLMVRDFTPPHLYPLAVRRDNRRRVDHLFPLGPMTREILLRNRIPVTAGILRSLFKMNLELHLSYAKAHHPRYWRLLGRRLRDQMWRLEAPPRSGT